MNIFLNEYFFSTMNIRILEICRSFSPKNELYFETFALEFCMSTLFFNILKFQSVIFINKKYFILNAGNVDVFVSAEIFVNDSIKYLSNHLCN